MQYLSINDFVFVPFWLAIILVIARIYRNRMIATNPEYKYYLPGLYAKLFGGFGLIMVYTLYYPGGDTVQYFNDAVVIAKLLFYNPSNFFHIMTHPHSPSVYYYFNSETGYPCYYRDANAFFVCKLAFFIVMFSFKSIIAANLILASISFIGVWKLYKVFVYEFPQLKKQLAIAVFFMPSVFFWGSGLLKDTFTFSAMGFFTYSFYMVFIRRKKIMWNIITLILSSFVIVSIKPYILVGLLPGILIWIIHNLLLKIKGSIARTAALPVLITIVLVFGFAFLKMLESSLNDYSINNVLEKAVVTQQDLKKDYYKGNSFDIGDFDPTVSSMLLKVPAAINASLFRPFILEANNLVMFISSLENLFILLFTLRVLFMTRIFGFFKSILSSHLLTFAFIFSMFFAFSVGISTSNFGSLVRYKIPVIPFYVACLFIVQYKARVALEIKRKRNEEILTKQVKGVQLAQT
jgi:hypothetical protein